MHNLEMDLSPGQWADYELWLEFFTTWGASPTPENQHRAMLCALGEQTLGHPEVWSRLVRDEHDATGF